MGGLDLGGVTQLVVAEPGLHSGPGLQAPSMDCQATLRLGRYDDMAEVNSL